jgi:hypothetical protein
MVETDEIKLVTQHIADNDKKETTNNPSGYIV